MTAYEPVRRTSTKERPRKRTTVQYSVRKVNGEIVVVCAKTFQSVTTMGKLMLLSTLIFSKTNTFLFFSLFSTDRKRLNRLSTYFFANGSPRKEQRGGKRENDVKQEATDSVITFLQQLENIATESHYGRSGTKRLYLSPLLSTRQLWLHWKKLYLEQNPEGWVFTYKHFKTLFLQNFNMAYGTPRTDACSTCENLKSQVQQKDDKSEAAELELQMHLLESKHFNRLQKEHRDECYTFNICFDLQQNMPLPRTNIGEVFYKRQLWLYNLGFVCTDSREDVYFYSWLESESARGSNEITSALFDLLNSITQHSFKRKKYRILSLFSDSCSGQNKNFTMMLALLMYVNQDLCPFEKIRFTFPVRGHSYMAPDRSFGRVEKEVRKHESILMPAGYHEILRRHGTLKTFTEWRVQNYKLIADNSIKKDQPFIRDSKRWLFKKNQDCVWTSSKYVGGFAKRQILKKNVVLKGLKAPFLASKSYVSEGKKEDVRSIINLLHCNDETKQFYETALA